MRASENRFYAVNLYFITYFQHFTQNIYNFAPKNVIEYI